MHLRRFGYCSPVIRRYFDCGPRERVRRALVFLMIFAVAYVPGAVTLAMLISGAE